VRQLGSIVTDNPGATCCRSVAFLLPTKLFTINSVTDVADFPVVAGWIAGFAQLLQCKGFGIIRLR
jgi:hypothetical protein